MAGNKIHWKQFTTQYKTYGNTHILRNKIKQTYDMI